jgi:putative ABC transport system permease protein
MRAFLRRLWYVMRQRRLDTDLAEDMEFHRAMKQRELESRGGDTTEAAFAARRAFGSAALARDHARDVWIATWLQDLARDVRFALRLLVKDRSFTLMAVLVLGLGIGVDNTLFIIVNAACLRGLPIDRVDRVVYVAARDGNDRELSLSFREFDDARATLHGYTGLAAFANTPLAVGDEGRAPDRALGTYLSANGFQMLHERPMLGRDFEPADDRPGAAAVAILGSGLWKSRYGGDPSIVGRAVRINGAPATVVGVMKDGFRFPSNTDVWQPLSQMPGLTTDRRTLRLLSAFGRMADGASIADVRGPLGAIAGHLSHDYPDTNQGIRITTVPINEKYSNKITDPNWVTFIVVGILAVLIACANVANLLLMRAIGRAREMPTRASLGATRSHLVRQLLVESALLAMLGGLVGLALSLLGVRLISSIAPPNTVPYWMTYTMDAATFAVLCTVCLSTVLVFGLAPAVRIARTDVNQVMKAGGRAGAAPGDRRWTTAFLTVEFALTILFLSALVVSVRTNRATERANLVINPTNLISTWITLPADKYPTPDVRAEFYRQLAQRLDGIPGISSTAVTTALPLGGAAARQLAVDGRPTSPGVTPPNVWTLTISSRYFEAMGLQMIGGRPFGARAGTSGHESAIVNQRFAQMYFSDADPIGRRIRLIDATRPTVATPWLTIVGVSPTVRQRPTAGADPVVYTPLDAAPPVTAAILVRAQSQSAGMAAPLREVVRAIDADLPLYRLMPMEQALIDSQWAGRTSLVISLGIIWTAVGLAAAGLYAVTAHSVAQRTQELGVRMALGARSQDVIRLVVGRVVLQLGLGVLAGVASTLAWAKAFGSTPDGYNLSDPASLIGASILLAGVAAISCLVPVRRATRVDPIVALRYE